jgi:inosine-uridine nucleoside N-ribohydrolase
MTIPVIFDTDAGTDIDDLYALALAVAHPGIELLGVTTVAGDARARARLVAKMLRLQGSADVPVLAGADLPLVPAANAGEIARRHPLTHCDLVERSDPEYDAEYPGAVEFILGELSRAERPVTLVGVGPWTNLAEVVRRADAAQRSMIGCLALMGGEVHLARPEHNVSCDPEAAALLLASGLPVFLGTWSVTRQLFFTMEEVDALLGRSESPLLRALHAGTRMWWATGISGKPGPVLYDAVPVFWAAGEREAISCVGLQALPVELEDPESRGTTAAAPGALENAPRVAETGGGHLAVTDEMDAAALKRRFVELVVDA